MSADNSIEPFSSGNNGSNYYVDNLEDAESFRHIQMINRCDPTAQIHVHNNIVLPKNAQFLTFPFKGIKSASAVHISGNNISSLDGIPNKMESFFAINNKITSIVDISNIIHSCKSIDLTGNPINAGGIGLLLIKRLKYFYFTNNTKIPLTDLNNKPTDHFRRFNAFTIINSYIKLEYNERMKSILKCQEELIEAGYEEFAEL